MVLEEKIFHRPAVGNHVAAEPVLLAQAVDEELVAARDRDAVVVVVAAHRAHDVRLLDQPLPGPEVEHFHLAVGDVRVHAVAAVAPALGFAVDGEVLGRGGDALLLHRGGHADAQFRDEIRVLAVRFHHPAPAWVARQVHDGRVHVRITQCPALAACHVADAADQVAVPRRAQRDLGREVRGAVRVDAADALVGEVHGNPQAGLFNEPLLHLVEREGHVMGGPDPGVFLRIVEDAVVHLVDVGDAVLPDLVFPLRGGQRVIERAAFVAVEGGQLTGFLLQRHLGKEVLDPGVHRLGRVLVYVAPTVFVQVDPAVVVKLRPQRGEGGARGRGLGVQAVRGEGGEEGRRQPAVPWAGETSGHNDVDNSDRTGRNGRSC